MKNLGLGLVCLTVLASCGGSNGGGKSGPNSEKFRGLNTLTVDEKVIYISDCQKSKSDGETVYSMSMFEIEMKNTNKASFNMKQAIFSENCEVPLMETEVRGEGMFLNNNTLLKSVAEDIFMRPLMDEITDALNENSACGFNNWTTASQKNITHTDCVEGSLNSDVYMDSKDNGATLTIYMCEENAPVSNKCEKVALKKAL